MAAVVVGAAVCAVAALVGCASGGTSTAGESAAHSGGSTANAVTEAGPQAGQVAVVASTSVWADVVRQVGGDHVVVTALIADPATDPHSFEPNAQAQLALSKAALVVRNGGGYDDFVQQLLDAVDATGSRPAVIDAVGISGHRAGPDLNEHVWYDLPTVDAVARAVADNLAAARPEQALTFQANLAVFTDRIASLDVKAAAIKATHAGEAVAVTEPVPLYLTDAAGLVNATPPAFSKAIEDGTDVPPTVLSDTVALLTGKKVRALIYNEQTSSPQTEQLQAAAIAAGIPVVPVTETLPADTGYLGWMDATITALAGALE